MYFLSSGVKGLYASWVGTPLGSFQLQAAINPSVCLPCQLTLSWCVLFVIWYIPYVLIGSVVIVTDGVIDLLQDILSFNNFSKHRVNPVKVVQVVLKCNKKLQEKKAQKEVNPCVLKSRASQTEASTYLYVVLSHHNSLLSVLEMIFFSMCDSKTTFQKRRWWRFSWGSEQLGNWYELAFVPANNKSE